MYKTFLVTGLALGVLYGQEQTPDERLRTATTVLHEILAAPDKFRGTVTARHVPQVRSLHNLQFFGHRQRQI